MQGSSLRLLRHANKQEAEACMPYPGLRDRGGTGVKSCRIRPDSSPANKNRRSYPDRAPAQFSCHKGPHRGLETLFRTLQGYKTLVRGHWERYIDVPE